MAIRALAGTSALVLVMSTTTLLADVTPEQVWQALQDSITANSGMISAESAVRNGDVLEVTNITIGDPAKGTVALEVLDFQDLGDGTVGILMNDSFPVVLNIPAKADDPTSKPGEATFNVDAKGTEITASGDVGAISYAVKSPSLTVTLATIDGAPATDSVGTLVAKIADLSSTYVVTTGDTAAVTEDFAAKSIDLAVSAKNPADGSKVDLKANLADLASKFDIKTPKGFAEGDLPSALAKGFAMTGNFGFGTTSFDLNTVDSTGKPTQIVGGLASGSTAMTVDAAKFDYSTSTKGVAFKVVSPDIPVPDASLSWGEAGFHLLMPAAKSETPADFAFLVNLVDLAPSEAIWALVDPGKGLDHSPATVKIDTKGKATMTKDIFADAAALEGGSTDAPGLLNALDITNIDLKALGAEITAAGAFTFDNSDMTTFSGVPAPTGKIDIKAVGLNAVLDTLVKMGLVPEDQVTQGRMMLAMFANTSATSDEITSTLEFKDKHFLANGQQLQ